MSSASKNSFLVIPLFFAILLVGNETNSNVYVRGINEGNNDVKIKMDGIISSSVKNYIMDFQDISYLNSIGVGAIAATLKKVKKFQGNIKLINVSPAVQELFEMTRLTKVFEIFDNEEDAIKSYETK